STNGRSGSSPRCRGTDGLVVTHKESAHVSRPMPLDPGTVHRFAMLERAVKSFAKTGRFDESLKLVEEMLTIAPEDAGLSKLKARLAADLVNQAVQAQKIAAAAQIVELVESKIPAAHLGPTAREHPAKAKYRVRARLVRDPNPQHVVLATSKGVPRNMIRFGVFEFEIDGTNQRLAAYKSVPQPGHHHEDESLFVPLRDATSGKETYGAARY